MGPHFDTSSLVISSPRCCYNMALKVAVCALLVGVALGLPQYNYEPPKAPETLYETPAESVQEPVSLYETPAESVQEPVQLYETPIIAEPQNIAPVVVPAPA